MADRYQRVNQVFEKAVCKLQDNLIYLANEGKVSDKFITIQNLIIKALIDYQHQTSEIIAELQLDNTKLMLRASKEYKELLDIKEAFEALCIIHGIMDFPQWISRGRNALVAEAVQYHQDKMIQLPFELTNLIDEMAEEDREKFYSILHKKYQQRNHEELQLIKKQKNAGTQRN